MLKINFSKCLCLVFCGILPDQWSVWLNGFVTLVVQVCFQVAGCSLLHFTCLPPTPPPLHTGSQSCAGGSGGGGGRGGLARQWLVQWHRALDELLTWATRSHLQAMTDICLSWQFNFSLTLPLPLSSFTPLALFVSNSSLSPSLPLSSPKSILILSISSPPPPLFPPSLALLACGTALGQLQVLHFSPLAGWEVRMRAPLRDVSVHVLGKSGALHKPSGPLSHRGGWMETDRPLYRA